MPTFDRTKIVCTIGPATQTRDAIRKLVRAGMDVARLNFSHGDFESHAETIGLIRDVERELGVTVTILQDLSGPKLRVGEIGGDGARLRRGAEVWLTDRPVVGDERLISVNHKGLIRDIEPGQRLMLADGTIELKVLDKGQGKLRCRVKTGGLLTSRKGVNAPDSALRVASMTKKDRADLEFGVSRGVDFVALSFVRRAEDIRAVRKELARLDSSIPVLAKIEKSEAIVNLESILDESDGAMIARGDLGVEIPLERVAVEQKRIIRESNKRGKPVITATQMLRSMVENPNPTRAEVTDVSNAIYDGTDAIMLSEETAVGRYPDRSVRFMSRICSEAEADLPYTRMLAAHRQLSTTSAPIAIGHAVCNLAHDLGLDAVVCCTHSGFTARLIAKHRPQAPIIAVTPVRETVRRLTLVWGVKPILIEHVENTDDMIDKALAAALGTKLLKPRNRVVVTAGVPIGVTGSTNLIKIETVG